MSDAWDVLVGFAAGIVFVGCFVSFPVWIFGSAVVILAAYLSTRITNFVMPKISAGKT